MNKISVVINTLNEEKNLPQALSSIKTIADEVVVVDMKSEDKTVQIAKKFGAKIYTHKRINYVEPARNFAISKATHEWILILDADEEIPPSLATKIRKVVKNPRGDYFRIPRKNIIFGKWVRYSRWWPDYNIRFFKKGFVTWNEVIHSVPMTKGVGLDLLLKEKNAIMHNHYESIEQFVSRLNRYSSEHAKILIEKGYKFDFKDLIKKPVNEFMSRYFFGEGYKDGLHGLALAGLQSFSEFVMYLKIWQNEKFDGKGISLGEVVSEMKTIEKEVHYWQADAMFKKYGGISNRIKRKLKIF